MNYLESARRQFELDKHLAEKAMEQLPDEALLWQYDAESNSIATIVKHLWGNMLSRWTNFLTEDGEKPWRERDAEFEAGAESSDVRAVMMQQWNEGWQCLFDALESITDADLERIIYIRAEPHTVLAAIQRQIGHYAYHVGQIVYVAKMVRKADWQTLSIARNKSKDYNEAKFSQEKDAENVTGKNRSANRL